MTTKDFLHQAFVANKEIEIRLERIAHLQAVATKTTTAITGAPKVNSILGSLVENAVIELQDQMSRLAEEITRFIEVKKKIAAAISLLVNPSERAILEYRYLCFYSWPQISALMKTGASNVFKIHRSALKKFRAVQ